jgi:hypothetical protein
MHMTYLNSFLRASDGILEAYKITLDAQTNDSAGDCTFGCLFPEVIQNFLSRIKYDQLVILMSERHLCLTAVIGRPEFVDTRGKAASTLPAVLPSPW